MWGFIKSKQGQNLHIPVCIINSVVLNVLKCLAWAYLLPDCDLLFVNNNKIVCL